MGVILSLCGCYRFPFDQTLEEVNRCLDANNDIDTAKAKALLFALEKHRIQAPDDQSLRDKIISAYLRVGTADSLELAIKWG